MIFQPTPGGGGGAKSAIGIATNPSPSFTIDCGFRPKFICMMISIGLGNVAVVEVIRTTETSGEISAPGQITSVTFSETGAVCRYPGSVEEIPWVAIG